MNGFELGFGNFIVSQRVHLRPWEVQTATEIRYGVAFVRKGEEVPLITNARLERKER